MDSRICQESWTMTSLKISNSEGKGASTSCTILWALGSLWRWFRYLRNRIHNLRCVQIAKHAWQVETRFWSYASHWLVVSSNVRFFEKNLLWRTRRTWMWDWVSVFWGGLWNHFLLERSCGNLLVSYQCNLHQWSWFTLGEPLILWPNFRMKLCEIFRSSASDDLILR